MKYNSFLAWTSVITKLYLPLRTPRKPEEFKVTMCVAVVTTSGVATLYILLAIKWSKIVIMTLVDKIINTEQELWL